MVMTRFCISRTVISILSVLFFLHLPYSTGQEVSSSAPTENVPNPEPIEPLQIKLSVNEVRLDVVVLDNNGNPVTDLTAGDFEVFQNGGRQKILSSVYIDNQSTAAAKPSAKPTDTRKDAGILPSLPTVDLKREDTRRTILFVVDDLSMSFENGHHARMALRNFVEKQMQPGDMVAILRTGHGNSALQFFLSDKNEALARINSMRMERTLSPIPDGSHLFRVYDNQLSTLSYSLRALKDMPGRKILVMVSATPTLRGVGPGAAHLNEYVEAVLSETDPEKAEGQTVNLIQRINFYDLYNDRFSRLADDALRAGVVVNFLNINGLSNMVGVQDIFNVIMGTTTIPQHNQEIRRAWADAQSLSKNPETQVFLFERMLPELFEEARNADPINALNPLPVKTGGVIIENSNFFLDGVGRETESLMKGYYLISYTPPPDTFSTGDKEIFNQIKVNVNRRGVQVYTRDGFYNRLESEMDAAAAANPLQDAIFSPFLHADLDVNIAAGYVKDARAGYLVRAWIHTDPENLKLVENEDGSARIDIEAFCVTSDINGFVQDSRRVYFSLSNIRSADDMARIQKHGIRFAMLLPVKKPGFYYVRVAVEDKESGKIGSAYQFVEIPDLEKRGAALSSIFIIAGGEDLKWMHSDVAKEMDEGDVFLPALQDEEVRSPALRTYTIGDRLQILTMLYNADEKGIAGSEIEKQYILYKDGAEFLRGETQPVIPDKSGNLEGIPITQRFTMGSDLPPGDYVFQLQITDKRNSARREAGVTQAISFTVVDNPLPEQLDPLVPTVGRDGADNPTPEQLIVRHLESIGEPAALSQVKSIAFAGTSDVQFIMGSHGSTRGTAVLVSEKPGMAMVMEFPSVNYRGEYFAYDGKAVTVGQIAPGMKSPIADFLFLYDKIIKNGLLGGVYSTAWPLLNIDGNRANMRVGKTRVEGVELYELEYRPRDYHRDMRIRLYFDPETWRHVRTDYYLSTYRGFNTYPTLTEKFEDFKKVGNLMLPHSYTIHLEDWGGHIAIWGIKATQWIFNRPDIDPDVFRAKN